MSGSLPRLHVVTDDSMLARGGWEGRAKAVLGAGGRGLALHLRGPRTDGAVLLRLATALLSHARAAGALLVVNDRVDVALAAEVDGVHLGARSLPTGVARGLWPGDRWLGVSARGVGEASAARLEGADYAFLGTIFPTPSHPGVSGMGTSGVEAVARAEEGFPIIAIGGIDAVRAGELVAAGAHGVAVMRGVWEANAPARAVARYLERIGEGTAERAGAT